MTPTEYAQAMREAFPEPPGEVEVVRAIDRREADRRAHRELTEPVVPSEVFWGKVTVHPGWAAALGDPV